MGNSYQVTNTVTIPTNAPPSYYLILKTDDQNAVFESNKANNWRAFGVGQYRDADGDAIPDWWEQQYFGSIANCAPDADPDGDGVPNLPKYVADTNPTNAFSVLRISGIVLEASGIRLEWQSGVEAWQFLERGTNLSLGNWCSVHTNRPPTPPQTNFLDLSTTNRTLFYRIRVERQ